MMLLWVCINSIISQKMLEKFLQKPNIPKIAPDSRSLMEYWFNRFKKKLLHALFLTLTYLLGKEEFFLTHSYFYWDFTLLHLRPLLDILERNKHNSIVYVSMLVVFVNGFMRLPERIIVFRCRCRTFLSTYYWSCLKSFAAVVIHNS